MATEVDFLPFAVGGGANVLTQAQYVALTTLLQNGFQSGLAQSVQLNKVWRQSSIMAAILAHFIANETNQNVIDDGTTATILTNLATAVAVCARQNPVLTDTGTANTYAAANLAAFTAYPSVSGLVIDITIAHTNTSASTLNVDGLGAKPIYGLGGVALQGGELPANSVASLLYVVSSLLNSGNGAWVLMECAGGAQQVGAATQSQHALQKQQKGYFRATSSTTLVVPAGVTQMVGSGAAGGGGGGGGGGGTGASSTGAGGGGGGAGQSAVDQLLTVSPGETLTITIGAGGKGALAASGSAGGTTSVVGSVSGTLITLTGGLGGTVGTYGASNVAGGFGGSGYPTGTAGADTNPATSGSPSGAGGVGGSSPFGGGGAGGRGASSGGLSGQAAGGYGAGGGGGGGSYVSGSNSGSTGGAASSGFMFLQW